MNTTIDLLQNKKQLLLWCGLLCMNLVFAQSYQALDALSDFRNPPTNWQVVGEVTGTPADKTLTPKAGKGVLLCTPKESGNLLSNLEHGDLELSLDVMIPKGSNSGIYLQGRYEIQVFDSWGVANPLHSDAGGIYQRWDDSRGKNTEGYEGHAPRLNAVKAPGLWNHLDISFVAPRFDAAGKKIANARFAKVTWNGVVIHQNVEVFGPTRASAYTDEKALGALMLQGDYGNVAYKNIRITQLGNRSVAISTPVKYAIYENAYTQERKGAILEKPKPKDLATLKPVKTGETDLIDATVSKRGVQFYVFTGKFKVAKEGDYDFKSNCQGYANIWVDDVLLLSDDNTPWYGLSFNEETVGKKHLTAGEHTFKIHYTHRDWERTLRALALFVKGENEGWQALHAKQSELEYSKTVLNLVEPKTQPIFQRSFVVFDNKKRTHAVNVGFPEGVHYSYDTKQGALLHVWRGGFLNTTEMWHERGEEQTAAPLGMSVSMTGQFSLITKDKLDAVTESALRYEGMKLVSVQGQKVPQFSYVFQNISIKDWTQPTADKLGLQRTLSLSAKSTKLNVLLATATHGIQKIAEGVYAIDGAAYFIKLPIGTTATVVEHNGKTLLMTELKEQLFTYEIVF
ncbi:MAG: family 16 glycoside hydrolase [Saprospiraceae bacterium]|nr:family 16 glycoside hydrolase [Saprospiraceae bacterium]